MPRRDMNLFDGNKICEKQGKGGLFEVFMVEGGYSIRVPDSAKPIKLQDLPILSELLLEAFRKEIKRGKP